MKLTTKMNLQAAVVWIVSTTILSFALDVHGVAFLGIMIGILGMMLAFKRFGDSLAIERWLAEWQKTNDQPKEQKDD